MRRYFIIIIVIFHAGIITPCRNHGPFAFHLPDVAPWRDLPVKIMRADDGIELAYRETGPTRSPRVLVFLPGSTMYGYYYVPFAGAVSRYGIRVRVIDLRGHGSSGGPRGDVPREDSLTEDLAAHLRHVRKGNPDAKIVIGGHSMGAGVCGRFLFEKGGTGIDGVAYLAPFFHYRQPGVKDTDYVEIDYCTAIFGGDHAFSQAYHPGGTDPRLVRRYTNLMSKASMVPDYHAFIRKHPARTLVIIGTDDELFVHEATRDMFAGNRNADVKTFGGAHHLDVVTRAADDLARWILSL